MAFRSGAGSIQGELWSSCHFRYQESNKTSVKSCQRGSHCQGWDYWASKWIVIANNWNKLNMFKSMISWWYLKHIKLTMKTNWSHLENDRESILYLKMNNQGGKF